MNSHTLKLLLLACLIIQSPVAISAGPFSFTKIAETTVENLPTSGIRAFYNWGMNNLGEVVFSTSVYPSPTKDKIFRSDGVTTVEVDHTIGLLPDVLPPYNMTGTGGVGINDDGEISYSLVGTDSTTGSASYRTRILDQTTARDVSSDFSAALFPALNINSLGQVGWAQAPFVNSNNQVFRTIRQSDGITSAVIGEYESGEGLSNMPINDNGHVAHMTRSSPQSQGVIKLYRGPDLPQLDRSITNLGLSDIVTNNRHIGFNNRSAVSFVSNDSVYFLDLTSLSSVSNTDGVLNSFHNSTSLNEMNAIAFIATHDNLQTEGLYIGFPSGDPPREIIQTGDVLFGSTVSKLDTGSAGLRTNSLNDEGQIVFKAELADERVVLVRADPDAGALPDNPILPVPNVTLPGPRGGWPIDIPLIIAIGSTTTPVSGSGRSRVWIDPDIAIGYDYEVSNGGPAVESILIPVPLPNGDSDFNVVVDGSSYPMQAGVPFFFTDFSASGVTEFKVAGIDAEEMLSSDDPTAFVAGLTFVSDPIADFTINMIPITDNVPDINLVGEPVIDGAGESGVFIWRTGDGRTLMQIVAGAPTQNGQNTEFEGNFTSGSAISDLLPIGLEGGDKLVQSAANRIDFDLMARRPWNDQISFIADINESLCVELNAYAGGLFLGPDKVEVPPPYDINAMAECNNTSIEVDGAPTIGRSVDVGWFIWRASGIWHNRFVTGGTTHRYEGSYSSSSMMTNLMPISIEGSDVLGPLPSTQLDFSLRVVSPYVDGYNLIVDNSASTCVSLFAPTDVSIYLGPDRVEMPSSFDLTTLEACQGGPNIATRGKPVIDRTTDKGIFVWERATNDWSAEVVTGDTTTSVIEIDVVSQQLLRNITEVGIESNDIFTVLPQQLDMILRVRAPWADGFEFSTQTQSGTCVSTPTPMLPIYLGPDRVEVGNSLNLDTQMNCQ